VKGEFQGGERGQAHRRWWNYRQKRKKRTEGAEEKDEAEEGKI